VLAWFCCLIAPSGDLRSWLRWLRYVEAERDRLAEQFEYAALFRSITNVYQLHGDPSATVRISSSSDRKAGFCTRYRYARAPSDGLGRIVRHPGYLRGQSGAEVAVAEVDQRCVAARENGGRGLDGSFAFRRGHLPALGEHGIVVPVAAGTR